MTPIIIAALVVKDLSGDDKDLFRVVVAFKTKHNSPVWHSKQMNFTGWPPDYYFKTVAVLGRPNNQTEAEKYFNNSLDTSYYEKYQ